MDNKLHLHVWHNTIVRTTSRTNAGYTCQMLLNRNSVVCVVSFSIMMEYAEWNHLLKAVKAVKTKEGLSKNGTCSLILFFYSHKERFVLVQPFMRKYNTGRGRRFSQGAYCKSE